MIGECGRVARLSASVCHVGIEVHCCDFWTKRPQKDAEVKQNAKDT
jgi:hypothetical protein